MKQLHDKINIIPVIGKADTMTPEEVNRPFPQELYYRFLHCQVASFKTVIMEQIAAAKIKIYEFPEVMHLSLLRDKSSLVCPPEVSPYPILFFASFHFVVFQVEDGEEAERKENRRMKVRFFRHPSNWRS